MRRTPIHDPNNGPCSISADAIYSEQVGRNRQACPI
jgi:hypothetical protein